MEEGREGDLEESIRVGTRLGFVGSLGWEWKEPLGVLAQEDAGFLGDCCDVGLDFYFLFFQKCQTAVASTLKTSIVG